MAILDVEPLMVQNMLDQADTLILVDVREVDEFEEVRSPDAKNFPLSSLHPANVLNELGIEKEKNNIPLYFICRSGKRSQTAASMFEKGGYKNVHNVEGGMNRWVDLNLPMLSGKSS